MTDPTTDRDAERPLTDRITEVLGLTDDAAARRALWREAAEKGIEHGVDWTRIVLILFRDIERLADLMGDGLADAWDEGWNECVDHRTCTYTGPGECPDAPPNPHRRVTDDGEDA